MSNQELLSRYEEYQKANLKLNMTRGVPCPDQLALSDHMLTMEITDWTAKGIGDARNYGGLQGTLEIRTLFAELLGADSPDNIIAGGASSLNMMYDSMLRAMYFGVGEGFEPWSKGKPKFICPVPGYDRHFNMCESLGLEMTTVPMTPDGPDMDAVERLCADPAYKGIWCVPKYSNPDGIIYSDEKVRRMAALRPAAPDFRIFWDNAYAVHDLTETPGVLLDLMGELKKNGNEDMAYIFMSFAKISFAGAGVAAMYASPANIKWAISKMTFQTICPDKINQLRHAYFFVDAAGVMNHMAKHRALLKPRFDTVLSILKENLSDIDGCQWTEPSGGYFVSLFVPKGKAARVVKLCADAGVSLTPAGSTYPHKNDPDDRNIRIAPTFPPVEDLKTAMEILCLCVKLACAE